MNALTHYLTPYGLEQFSGAAWGTRDVAQGPMELLLSMQRYEEAKQVLRIIFSNQDRDGGWPQWWMFDSYNDIRADSAHGDVIYWCLIALSNYIRISGDYSFLDEKLPFHNRRKTSRNIEKSLADHINRLVKRMTGSFVPGTSLVQFGGGDWNDSLQPVSRDLARRMISAWTVEMSYQALSDYAEVCRMRGEDVKAGKYEKLCEQIKSDFNSRLVKDGVVAGYGLAEDDGTVTLLLHPSDTRTGIKYSILPMNRGIISRIFTADQAESHQELIEMHLKGPDGARLMDRPLRYSGGIEKLFRRAESSTFFGREIGLMYVHEHIRYAEALAITGKADAFLRALRQAIPVAYREIVPSGDIRQANCYFSSSDVIFMNRYEADRLYTEIMAGNLTLRMGWRIYSSGPGIFIGIVVSRLLGLRVRGENVIIDPVMPRSLDGIQASIIFMDRSLKLIYSVREGNYSPNRICINGTDVQFTEEESIYRRGGAVIPAGIFSALPGGQENRVEIHM
jgi:cellobiose phosphorylase